VALDSFRSGMDSFLEVKNAKKYFFDHQGLLEMIFGGVAPPVRAVDGVSFQVRKGECLASSGERLRQDHGRPPHPADL